MVAGQKIEEEKPLSQQQRHRFPSAAAFGRRRRHAGLFALGAVLTGLAGCATPPAAPPSGTQLSAAEIRSTLVGNTGHGSSSKGDFVIYVAPDGTQRVKTPNIADTGRWRLTDDGHWCSRWQRIRLNAEECSTVFRDGDTIRFVRSDGSVASTIQSTPGNPENL